MIPSGDLKISRAKLNLQQTRLSSGVGVSHWFLTWQQTDFSSDLYLVRSAGWSLGRRVGARYKVEPELRVLLSDCNMISWLSCVHANNTSEYMCADPIAGAHTHTHTHTHSQLLWSGVPDDQAQKEKNMAQQRSGRSCRKKYACPVSLLTKPSNSRSGRIDGWRGGVT